MAKYAIHTMWSWFAIYPLTSFKRTAFNESFQ